MNSKKIAVVGLGSSGIQSLSHFLSWSDYEIYSIYDPDMLPIGVGESVNPPFIESLENGCDFDIISDIEKLDGTLKFGTRYIGWREKDFVNPLISGGVAIHMNASKLKDFAIDRFKNKWGNKFNQISGKVLSIKNLDDCVEVIVEDKKYLFDYAIVCTGFPKNYENYVLVEDMPVNSCVVQDVYPGENFSESLYTDHIAMESGWMFRIPLKNRISYGYLFNDNITNINEIKNELSNFLNIEVEKMDEKVFNFNPYYAKNIIDGRIIKNGNNASFFEPMFANSLWIYEKINRISFDFIYNEINDSEANKKFFDAVKKVENMIRFHYVNGSKFDSHFWSKSKQDSKKHLNLYNYFHEIQNHMKSINKKKLYTAGEGWVFNERCLNILDKNFQYNYFTDEQ